MMDDWKDTVFWLVLVAAVSFIVSGWVTRYRWIKQSKREQSNGDLRTDK